METTLCSCSVPSFSYLGITDHARERYCERIRKAEKRKTIDKAIRRQFRAARLLSTKELVGHWNATAQQLKRSKYYMNEKTKTVFVTRYDDGPERYVIVTVFNYMDLDSAEQFRRLRDWLRGINPLEDWFARRAKRNKRFASFSLRKRRV